MSAGIAVKTQIAKGLNQHTFFLFSFFFKSLADLLGVGNRLGYFLTVYCSCQHLNQHEEKFLIVQIGVSPDFLHGYGTKMSRGQIS